MCCFYKIIVSSNKEFHDKVWFTGTINHSFLTNQSARTISNFITRVGSRGGASVIKLCCVQRDKMFKTQVISLPSHQWRYYELRQTPNKALHRSLTRETKTTVAGVIRYLVDTCCVVKAHRRYTVISIDVAEWSLKTIGAVACVLCNTINARGSILALVTWKTFTLLRPMEILVWT